MAGLIKKCIIFFIVKRVLTLIVRVGNWIVRAGNWIVRAGNLIVRAGNLRSVNSLMYFLVWTNKK